MSNKHSSRGLTKNFKLLVFKLLVADRVNLKSESVLVSLTIYPPDSSKFKPPFVYQQKWKKQSMLKSFFLVRCTYIWRFFLTMSNSNSINEKKSGQKWDLLRMLASSLETRTLLSSTSLVKLFYSISGERSTQKAYWLCAITKKWLRSTLR